MNNGEFDIELYNNVVNDITKVMNTYMESLLSIEIDNPYESLLKVYTFEFIDNIVDSMHIIALTNVINVIFNDEDDIGEFKLAEEVLEDVSMLIATSDNWLDEFQNERLALLNDSSHSEYTSQDAGYIYVMMNPSMQGVIKIGLTRRTPEERLEELSKATGVPTPFILVYKEYFSDCVKAEKIIHSLLEDRGQKVSSNREFFNTDIPSAIKLIQEVKESDLVASNTQDYIENDSFLFDDDKSLSEQYFEKGVDYLNGYGEYLQDYDNAIEYLEKAGELGNARAYYELGNLYKDYSKDEEFNLNVKKSIKYFEKGRKLDGKFANYCNAGLALCYLNSGLELLKVRGYNKNEQNAQKCWLWFFDNINIDNSDFYVAHHISDCLDEFLLNEECYEGYKEVVFESAYNIIKICRYDLYQTAGTFREKENDYLSSLFGKKDLERNVNLSPINIYHIDEDCSILEVNVEKGMLNINDVISLNSWSGGAYRLIKNIELNGEGVNEVKEGQNAKIEVRYIMKDFDGYLGDYTIDVIGNTEFDKESSDLIKVIEPENNNEYVVDIESETYFEIEKSIEPQTYIENEKKVNFENNKNLTFSQKLKKLFK